MAAVGQHQLLTFPNPVNGTGPIDANIVRTNDNITATALNAHDADTSIHIQSGTLALRPVTATEGSVYAATDTGVIYIYVSGAWANLGGTARYGGWEDTTTQTAVVNTATRFTFNTIGFEYGTTLVSSAQMRANYAGVYNFQWSGQFINTSSLEHDIDVWVRVNGVDVVGSTGRVSVPPKHGSVNGHVLPAWNYFLSLGVNSYVELYWATTNTAVFLSASAATAVSPSTASLIATMNKIGEI